MIQVKESTWISFFSLRISLSILIFLSMIFEVEANEIKNFDRIWSTAKSQIFPKEKSELFTEEKRILLRKEAIKAKSTEELAAILNPFLLSLNVSHTYLYDSNNPDYYMMRSLFTTHIPSEPKLHHSGVQVQILKGDYVVRNVLEGYPAQKAGVQRGDILKAVDGEPFHPFKSFAGKTKTLTMNIVRNEKSFNISIKSVYEGPQASYIQATKNSIRLIQRNGKKVGYVHLWSGTDDGFLNAMKDALSNQLKDSDALILDLRDGFGGAWWDYLDPFYLDSKDYFVATKIARDGTRSEIKSEFYANKNPYLKPMVVIINEGVRSGKEAIAFNLQKTKRATLLGTPTAGAFVGGKGIFADENKDYLLYLSTFEMLLDGQKIEGVAVKPDILVQYPLDTSFSDDPQLLKAVDVIAGK